MKANQNARLSDDGHAQASLISGLILLGIALVVGAITFPLAIDEVEGADTANWTASTVALWGLLGLIIVAAFIIIVLRTSGVL